MSAGDGRPVSTRVNQRVRYTPNAIVRVTGHPEAGNPAQPERHYARVRRRTKASGDTSPRPATSPLDSELAATYGMCRHVPVLVTSGRGDEVRHVRTHANGDLG